jgi:hypothetical protein
VATLSNKKQERVDLIKSMFESVRAKKLKQKMNRKTAMIRATNQFVWMDTHSTYPSRWKK